MTTCRGSAPGSIVTYSLGITPVDPLEYGLPFERFLNPDRVTMPDIDIDFQDSRRDEVIEYVTRKYGDDRVAQIITFGTLGAKAAIRDVGRAMGLTYARGRSGREGGPARAEHLARPRRRDVAAAARADGGGRSGRQAHRHREAAGRRVAPRLDPCRRDRHLARAADRDHAAPARDRRQDHDDPVRDARLRGARPPEVRLPGPHQPHDPGRCRRPGGEAPRRQAGRRHAAARRREDVRAARPRRHDGRLPAGGLRDAPIRQASSSRPRCATWPPWSPSSGPDRWRTSPPTSAASTARSRSRTSTSPSSPRCGTRTGSSCTRRTS